MGGSRVFKFENRLLTIDHATSALSHGFHVFNFSICENGECTMYRLEVDSDLVEAFYKRQLALATYLDNHVHLAVVVKKFKEN